MWTSKILQSLLLFAVLVPEQSLSEEHTCTYKIDYCYEGCLECNYKFSCYLCEIGYKLTN